MTQKFTTLIHGSMSLILLSMCTSAILLFC